MTTTPYSALTPTPAPFHQINPKSPSAAGTLIRRGSEIPIPQAPFIQVKSGLNASANAIT